MDRFSGTPRGADVHEVAEPQTSSDVRRPRDDSCRRPSARGATGILQWKSHSRRVSELRPRPTALQGPATVPGASHRLPWTSSMCSRKATMRPRSIARTSQRVSPRSRLVCSSNSRQAVGAPDAARLGRRCSKGLPWQPRAIGRQPGRGIQPCHRRVRRKQDAGVGKSAGRRARKRKALRSHRRAGAAGPRRAPALLTR